MICPHCATGGDLAATLPPRRNGASTIETNRYNGQRRRAANAHGRCPGGTWCDCAHVGTKYERRAVRTLV